MAAVTDLATLEAQMVTTITALDASDYDQGSLNAAWKEANIALDPSQDPAPTAHLAFAVIVDDAPVEERGACLVCTAAVIVRFLYRLRSGNQNADARMASSAASDVLYALRASNALEGVSIYGVNAGDKTLLTGEWLQVDVEVRATLNLEAVA